MSICKAAGVLTLPISNGAGFLFTGCMVLLYINGSSPHDRP